MARYRKHLVQAKRADLRASREGFEQGVYRASRPRVFVKAELAARRIWLAIWSRWVGVRARQTLDLERRRQRLTAPLDRLIAGFWKRVMGDKVWRHTDPSLWAWELVFGPEIDRLEPDIIHANDFRMLGIGARAALRARAEGRKVSLVWDAHEYLPGLGRNLRDPRWLDAQCAYEREYVPHADYVVTVSDTLADMLVDEYKLDKKPAVVMNTPYTEPLEQGQTILTVREVVGLADDVPVLVYSGGVSRQRGTSTMVEGLALLPGVHLILVTASPNSEYVLEMVALADSLGVGDRLHLAPYALPEHVVHYVSSADVGVHPTLHFPNHEISLATKFFEYAHARLPIVVSDVKTMSEMVLETGQGEVFVAGDTKDFARAVEKVLADPSAYRDAYDKPGLLEQWTWESQAEVLDAVYDKALEQAR
jgi:glycosyltransferase involved in cell wall biosynthesis